MRKKIMKDGNSNKIRINAEDMELYSLGVDDVIEITITKIEKELKGGEADDNPNI